MKFTARIRDARHNGINGKCLYVTNVHGPRREYVHLFFQRSPLEALHHSNVFHFPELVDKPGAALILSTALHAISDAKQTAIRLGHDHAWCALSADFACSP